MALSGNIPAVKDQAQGNLASNISAVTLSIPLESGDGSAFPQPYNGSATSGGTSTTLNSTGISAAIGGSAAVGKPIFNATDGSIAFIKTVSTNSLTTTPLLGGSDNTWQNSDAWRIDEFIATLQAITTNAYGVESVTKREQVLVIARSTDTLTVATGGRGYNGTTGQTFDSGDYVKLNVTSPNHQRIVDYLAKLAEQVQTDGTNIANFSLTTNGNGASLIGIEDAGGNYTSTNVEGALTEIDTRLDAAVTLAQIGLYGDGSDGVPTWTSGASLNPSTEKRYTTATLPSGQTLTVSSVNTPLIIHNTGSVTVDGTVDMKGKGGAGGAAAAASANASGSAGTDGASMISGFVTNKGLGGTGGTNGGGGGGGGGGVFAAGTNGSAGTTGAGGTAGAVLPVIQFAYLTSFLRGVVCGSGGGGGGNNSVGLSGDGAGGAGGGALVWYIGGNLTLGASSTIRCSGDDGANGSGTGKSGGGGGSGGMIIILVAGSITNSGVTLSAAGGAGGTGTGGGGSGGNGGAGAAGKIVIYSLSTGTLITA